MKKLFFLLIIVIVFICYFPACSDTNNVPTYLTIIHTNDIRSHLDNAARRATVINEIRDDSRGEDILLLDAGNVFSGTPYFTLYQGQADLWFMNYLHYNAMCLGNHEFDKGPVVLANFVNAADFPIISANIDFSKDKSLAKKIAPWVIIEQGKNRYGIFGLTTEETPEISSPGSNIIFNNYIDAAKKAMSDLQTLGITKIIALTNLSWNKDIELAKKVKGIDVIVGGRNGTIPDPYPVEVGDTNAPTFIVEAGDNGDYVGELKLAFNKDGIAQVRSGKLIKIDDTIPEDKTSAAKLAGYREPINNLMQNVIGETNGDFDGSIKVVRSRETALGDLIADAMLDAAKKTGATIALWNSGAVRDSIPAGNITLARVMSVLPFGNQLVEADLTGTQIIEALENGVSRVNDLQGRFPLVAGLRFSWDPDAPAGSRVKDVEINTSDKYQPVVNTSVYHVVTNDFIAQGGDGYTVFLQASNITVIGSVDYSVLSDYITAHSPLNPLTYGRITEIGQ